MARPTVIDLTIRMHNVTAVYDMGGELFDLLPPGSFARYWRLLLRRKINFLDHPLTASMGQFLRKFASRDFGYLKAWPWPRGAGTRMLFLDPIYCAVTPVEKDDVVIIHDVGTISHRSTTNVGAFGASELAYRRIQAVAPSLVFVSDFTKKCFLDLYPATYARAETIKLYFRSKLSGAPVENGPSRKTVLMVGGMFHTKNYVRAVEAFGRSGLHAEGYTLKLVGPNGDATREVRELCKTVNSVELCGFTSDETLRQLYLEARVLLFPSLNEGFGLPALEAPRLGALPVVSAGTVLEEVVGPAGIFVDPHAVEDIAKGLRLACGMEPEERARRLREICAYQEQYSLERFRSNWRAFLAQ